ncbi:hypothetical protein [Sulfurimonas sp.]|uniref:hypothetical protein n=1 Tax=Sulfurimonas sp. TaxID=2022749 RepID=UPI0025F263CE|nr:hypothetical protein [Sulfurimonas sp.]MBW6489454.1 BatD family protein [Sulfurimonas sp.]
MKKNLGRVILVLSIFLHVEIFASTYTWSAYANKTTAYVNEAVHLKYICKFDDGAQLVSIEFKPAGEYEKYLLKNLRESESIVDGKKISIYEFVLFAKVAGRVELEFETVMKQTTRDAIEEMVIGRDNVKKEESVKKVLKQELLTLEVKETNNSLSGEFDIEVKKNEPRVKAYEPYHMQILIKGAGNFSAVKPIELKIEGVKVFAGDVVANYNLSKDGERGEWSQKFAFVSEKDFTIPDINIEYFNLISQKIESLGVDAINVKVEGGFSKEELLDEAEQESFKFDYSYLNYMLVFIVGFLCAKIKIKKSTASKDKKEIFHQKIDEAKSLDELMIILVLSGEKRYEKIIFEIESKKLTSLKSAKKISKLI